jgi:hypothetical protein
MVTEKRRTPSTKRTAKAVSAKPRPLGQAMHEIARSIPPEAWTNFPKDASKKLDDYVESGQFDS